MAIHQDIAQSSCMIAMAEKRFSFQRRLLMAMDFDSEPELGEVAFDILAAMESRLASMHRGHRILMDEASREGFTRH